MGNLLDAAVKMAESSSVASRNGPTEAELRRATGLVKKLISGSLTSTDMIVLENMLNGMGTSVDQVLAAVQEEFR